MVEFLLAVAALALASIVLNLLSDFMSGRDSSTLEWGSVLVVTLVGSLLFWIFGWNGVLGVLAVLGGWSMLGVLLQRRDKRSDPSG